MYDLNNNEITSNYFGAKFNWSCSIQEEDLTNNVKWINGSSFNQTKIKFSDDRSYLGKVLEVKCTMINDKIITGVGTKTLITTAIFGLVET